MFNLLAVIPWWMMHGTPAMEGAGPMDWWVANSAKITVIVIQIIVLARLIVKMTPTPDDDTWLAKVMDFLKLIGIVIPTDEAEVKKVVDEMDTRTMHDTMGGGNGDDELMGEHLRIGQRRPGLRRAVRRIAFRHGHDLSDSDVDAVIEECAAKQAGGILSMLLEWITNNPETVLKIILMIIGTFTEEKAVNTGATLNEVKHGGA